ncbi:MAG TPA: TldD/PmbA family protein [Acidimicrobiales bacterium]|jgi:TldD protein|nr:TldD/PmbA family protein [Acidimicrobiales bacterium]
MTTIDETFTALPLDGLADAALAAARAVSGVSHAEVRVERTRVTNASARDGRLQSDGDGDSAGLSVRVLHQGTWGFAATTGITADDAAHAAREAIEVALISAALSTERVELAPEPAHQATWVSSYEVNPFALSGADRAAVLIDWTARLIADDRVDHADASLMAVQEDKYYADLAGSRTVQERIRLHPAVTAIAVDADSGAFETMRTVAPPVGRGWEYMTGTGWDWADELARLPEYLAEKMSAPTLDTGSYDVVIDPSNLWLTIHESIGHATELDRALGYEAAYAGTSFATFDQLDRLRYGSDVMHVTGDRTVEHGLATVGFDDEGVEGQSWDLIRDGVLVGYQLNRAMAARQGFDRSNGCAFADSAVRVPLQRMANVSLQPAAGGPSTDDLINAAGDGIYIVGDKSWSIDMQRYNFQFTGQRFYRIRNGRLSGQLKDLAYQGVTTEFWGSMEAVGGEQTYVLGGAFNCGKGQPGQTAAVSHGCPSALFRQVRILNTMSESGR